MTDYRKSRAPYAIEYTVTMKVAAVVTHAPFLLLGSSCTTWTSPSWRVCPAC